MLSPENKSMMSTGLTKIVYSRLNLAQLPDCLRNLINYIPKEKAQWIDVRPVVMYSTDTMKGNTLFGSTFVLMRLPSIKESKQILGSNENKKVWRKIF